MPAPIYIAEIGIFLGRRERARLLSHAPRGSHLLGEVCVIAHTPGMGQEGSYANRLGETVCVYPVCLYREGSDMSLEVAFPADIAEDMDHPHITISRAEEGPDRGLDIIMNSSGAAFGAGVAVGSPYYGRIGFRMSNGTIVFDVNDYYREMYQGRPATAG